MVVGGLPPLVRLNRCGGFDTGFGKVCYRAVRVEIQSHAHCVSDALIEIRSFHFYTLPRIVRHERCHPQCEIAHCFRRVSKKPEVRFGRPLRQFPAGVDRHVTIRENAAAKLDKAFGSL
jgi:hypothetical protein